MKLNIVSEAKYRNKIAESGVLYVRSMYAVETEAKSASVRVVKLDLTFVYFATLCAPH